MTVAVPSLIGQSQAAATASILAAGLILGTVTNAGAIVVSQNPAAGTQVALGSAVNFTMSFARVQAASAGFYGGSFRNIGDVFDVVNASEFQSSAVSTVPIGNPLYPLFGWMTQVPNGTNLYSWAAFGNSSPRSPGLSAEQRGRGESVDPEVRGMRFEPAHLRHIRLISADMRPGDRLEIAAAWGEPAAAMAVCLTSSFYARTLFHEMRPLAMYGLAPMSIMAGHARAWCFGTAAIDQHKIAFARASRLALSALFGHCSLMTNVVDKNDAAAVRWLEWLARESHRGSRIHPWRCHLPAVRDRRGRKCSRLNRGGRSLPRRG